MSLLKSKFDGISSIVHLIAWAIMGVGFLMQYFQIPFAFTVASIGGAVSFALFVTTLVMHIRGRKTASVLPDKFLTIFASLFCLICYAALGYFIMNLGLIPAKTLGGVWGITLGILSYIVIIGQDVYAPVFVVTEKH